MNYYKDIWLWRKQQWILPSLHPSRYEWIYFVFAGTLPAYGPLDHNLKGLYHKIETDWLYFVGEAVPRVRTDFIGFFILYEYFRNLSVSFFLLKQALYYTTHTLCPPPSPLYTVYYPSL